MFNQNVIIEVDATSYPYGLLSVEGGKSVRSNAGAEISAPDVFSIAHQKTGKGDSAVDRHLVRVDTSYSTTLPSGSKAVAVASAYVVLVVPHSVVTKANVALAFKKVVQFLEDTEEGATSSNLDRVLNNEP